MSVLFEQHLTFIVAVSYFTFTKFKLHEESKHHETSMHNHKVLCPWFANM